MLKPVGYKAMHIPKAHSLGRECSESVAKQRTPSASYGGGCCTNADLRTALQLSWLGDWDNGPMLNKLFKTLSHNYWWISRLLKCTIIQNDRIYGRLAKNWVSQFLMTKNVWKVEPFCFSMHSSWTELHKFLMHNLNLYLEINYAWVFWLWKMNKY